MKLELEMGIGNASTSSAIASMLPEGKPLEELTGKGARYLKKGLDYKMGNDKKKAIDINKPKIGRPAGCALKVGGLMREWLNLSFFGPELM